MATAIVLTTSACIAQDQRIGRPLKASKVGGLLKIERLGGKPAIEKTEEVLALTRLSPQRVRKEQKESVRITAVQTSERVRKTRRVISSQ